MFQEGTSWAASAAADAWTMPGRMAKSALDTAAGAGRLGLTVGEGALNQVINHPIETTLEAGAGAAAVVVGTETGVGAAVVAAGVGAAAATIYGSALAVKATAGAIKDGVSIAQTEGIGAIPGHMLDTVERMPGQALNAVENAPGLIVNAAESGKDAVLSYASAAATVFKGQAGDPALPSAQDKIESLAADAVPFAASLAGGGVMSAAYPAIGKVYMELQLDNAMRGIFPPKF
jgi:hypothetical protein